jgi:hypothetical protein
MIGIHKILSGVNPFGSWWLRICCINIHAVETRDMAACPRLSICFSLVSLSHWVIWRSRIIESPDIFRSLSNCIICIQRLNVFLAVCLWLKQSETERGLWNHSPSNFLYDLHDFDENVLLVSGTKFREIYQIGLCQTFDDFAWFSSVYYRCDR